MGIRPQIFTVFGLDDFDGEVDHEIFERQPFLSSEDIEAATGWELSYVKDYIYDHYTKEFRYYYDLMFLGGHCKCLSNVAGWKKSTGDYDSDTFRALSMLYPEFFESGYRVLPLEESEWTRKARWSQRPANPCGGIEFQEHWWYQQGFYWMTPIYAFVTKWLLDSIGIETDPTQYKWMLVWEWS